MVARVAWEQIFRDATQPEPDTSQLARRTAILDTVIDDLHKRAHASCRHSPTTASSTSIDRQGALIAAALACS